MDGHVPQIWEDRVVPMPEFTWMLNAYHDLATSRQLGGMSEYCIPISEYVAYAKMKGITDSEQLSLLWEVVHQVDWILLRERLEKQADEMKAKFSSP